MLGRCVAKPIYFAMLISLPSLLSLSLQASDTAPLNLNLAVIHNPHPILSAYSANDYMSSYDRKSDVPLKLSKQYPLGLVRFKADKSMRVRGWQVRKNIYFGQAKVGKKWGVGLVVDRGSHYYGINNRGLSYLKKF